MPQFVFTTKELVQLLSGAPLLLSVWIAWDRPKIRTPWVLLVLGHLSLLTYFFFTGQWGLWYMNVGFIVVGIIRFSMAQKIRNKRVKRNQQDSGKAVLAR